MRSEHNGSGQDQTYAPAGGISRRRFAGGALAVGVGALAGLPTAGCGGPEDRSRSPVLDDPLAVKGGPKTTPVSGVVYPQGYVGPKAAVRGPITVNGERARLEVAVLQDSAVGDWATNEFSRWYEQQTNVSVDWQVIASEDSMTKVNAMIASGDIPDIFMNMEFSPAQLMLYGQQGLFLPLDGLIQDYGIEVKRVFSEYPDSKSAVTSNDGTIYSLPYVNDCFHCNAWNNRIWIYQPWLDALGLDTPTTPDEFEAVLEAFKTEDPNGNGKADEIPLMAYNDQADPGSALDTYVMNAYLYNPGEPWIVLDNGRIDVVFNKDGWREGLRFLNRLYRKGLLAKESFTQTLEQFTRVGTNPDVPVLGVAKGGTWFAFTSIDESTEAGRRWKDYKALPPLRGPDGTQVASWTYYDAVTSGEFVITKACRNPGVALMWGDGLYELEAQLRSYLGPKAENWRWATEGETGINGGQALWSIVQRTDGRTEGLGWNQLGLSYRSNDFRLSERVDPRNPTFEKPLYEETKRAYHPYIQPKERDLPPLYMDEQQAATTSELETTLTNHVKGSMSKFILGELDINDQAEWDVYVDTIDSMGLRTYLDAYQAAYDAKYG